MSASIVEAVLGAIARLRLALGATRRIRAVSSRTSLAALRFPAARVGRLRFVPQDLRTVDPVRADEILSGYFGFDRRIVETTGSPFQVTPPSTAWLEGLVSFDWLRHLRARGGADHAAKARMLLIQWHDAHGRWHPVSWRPDIAARRLKALLCAASFLARDADAGFAERFSRILARHVRLLDAQYESLDPGEERIEVAIALAMAGLSLEGEDRLARMATRRLDRELRRQILPDGGHVSRDPGAPARIALALLPLAQLYPARERPQPAAIAAALDRIPPFIRLMRHADGAIARFNGMGPSEVGVLATLLAYDQSLASPEGVATPSGYQRLQAGEATVIVDVGRAPPVALSRRAHAGALAFEMTAGRQPIMVNCGAPIANRAYWLPAARWTAAHSTIVVGDRSSARFADAVTPDAPILVGPRRVTAQRDGLTLAASHDGYRRRFGVILRRTLTLDADGMALRGLDRVEGADAPYAARFHLHPGVSVVRLNDPSAVVLETPHAGRWLFRASIPMEIDETVLLTLSEGPRRALQVVIAARSGANPEISWSLARIAETEPEAGG